MYNLPGSIYLLLIFIFFQGFLVLFLIFLFADHFAYTKRRQKEAKLLQEAAHTEALKLLEDARLQSSKVIKDAETKAANIVSQAEDLSASFNLHWKSSLDNLLAQKETELSKIVTLFGEDLKNDFSKEKVTTLAGLDTVVKELKDEASRQIASYGDIMAKASVSAQQDIVNNYNKEFDRVRQSLTRYEEARMLQIKDSSLNLLLRISKEFFGQALSISDHENLVNKLVKDAKLDSF